MTQPTTSPTQQTATGDAGAASTSATDAATSQQAATQQGTAATQAPAAATAAAPANGQQAATTTTAQNASTEQGKTFTQEDLDRIINERLDRQSEAFRKQFAAALGIEDPNAKVDPAKALEQAQQQATAAREQANAAITDALARAAGIKDDRIDTFIKLVDVTGALKDVDTNDSAKVRAALKTAVDARAAEYPEWKATTVAAASGADAGAAGNGKRKYTRAELDGMSMDELAEIAPDLTAAAREGRIV